MDYLIPNWSKTIRTIKTLRYAYLVKRCAQLPDDVVQNIKRSDWQTYANYQSLICHYFEYFSIYQDVLVKETQIFVLNVSQAISELMERKHFFLQI